MGHRSRGSCRWQRFGVDRQPGFWCLSLLLFHVALELESFPQLAEPSRIVLFPLEAYDFVCRQLDGPPHCICRTCWLARLHTSLWVALDWLVRNTYAHMCSQNTQNFGRLYVFRRIDRFSVSGWHWHIYWQAVWANCIRHPLVPIDDFGSCGKHYALFDNTWHQILVSDAFGLEILLIFLSRPAKISSHLSWSYLLLFLLILSELFSFQGKLVDILHPI